MKWQYEWAMQTGESNETTKVQNNEEEINAQAQRQPQSKQYHGSSIKDFSECQILKSEMNKCILEIKLQGKKWMVCLEEI